MFRGKHITYVLAGLTLVVLGLSVPAALRDARDKGGFYLFSAAFLEDIPKRLVGPGKFRFVFQPLMSIILGVRNGLADARAGRPPYLYAMLFHRDLRREMMKSGFLAVANLLLMGVLVDSLCQWLILGISYPGPALVVGPVLIVTPYTISRALTNRLARLRKIG